MSRTSTFVAAALPLLLGAAGSAAAQQRTSPAAWLAAAVRTDALWAPVVFLSDDKLEGRGTGRRGG